MSSLFMRKAKIFFVLLTVLTFFSNSYAQEITSENNTEVTSDNNSVVNSDNNSETQKSENQNSDSIDYVVTAEKNPTTEFESANNIYIISEGDIFNSGKTTVIELLQSVSNVQVSEGVYGKSSTTIRMRGAAGDNPFSQVLILVNGRKINSPDMTAPNLLNIPLDSIKQIEIIDGGNSALYGSNAIGGIINITTKTNDKGLSISANVEYGSYNTINSQLSLGYGTEKIDANLSGSYTHTDGYREHNKTDYWTANVDTKIKPSEKISITPYVSYFGNTFELPGNLTYEEFIADPTKANATAVTANDKGYIWNIDSGINSVFEFTDALNLNFPISYTYLNRQFDNYGYSTYFYNYVQSKPQLKINPNLPYGKLNSLIGFDFSFLNYNGESYNDINRTDRFNYYNINQFEYSPFISASYSFPFNLSIEGGARYSMAPINATKELTNLNENETYSSFDYNASISYTLSNLITFYSKYATLYRLPFVDEKTMLTCFSGYHYSVFNKDLKPESGWNFEVGAKLNLEKLLRFDAVFFYMQMQNEIAYSSTLYTNVNMDPTQRIGCNLSLNFTPVKIISFKCNFTYTNSTFTSGDYVGKSIPLNANFTGYAQLEFSLPYGIYLGVDCSYIGQRYCSGDFLNVGNILPQVFLLGLSTRYTPPQLDNSLTIKFSATNLLNTSYPTFASYYHDPYYNYTSYSYYPADGIKFNFSLTYKY